MPVASREYTKGTPVKKELPEVPLCRNVASDPLCCLCIETTAGGEGEVAIVHSPEWNAPQWSVLEVIQRQHWVERNSQRPREDVHRSSRNDAERRAGAGEPIRHFVDVTIASKSNDELGSRGRGVRGNRYARVARSCGERFEAEASSQGSDDVVPCLLR